jgi:hypothetical protein
MRVAIMMLIAALFAAPVWAKGHGGGHGASGGHRATAAHGEGSHAAGGRGATSQNMQQGVALRGASGFVAAPGTSAPHSFANCPARLADGAFCPLHGLRVGGSFFGVQRGFVSEEAIPPAEGSHDSDLGPWIVFLWMGRGLSRAVHSLAAL